MTRLCGVLVLCAASLTGGLAGGRPPPAATKLFNECIAVLDAGKLSEARDCFEKVYKVYPSPVVLYNLAQTSEALGRIVESFDLYQSCATGAGGALTDDELADIRRRLEALTRRLGFIKVRSSATGLAVHIGGLPRIASSPRGIAVLPGNHDVRVSATDMKPWSERVRVKAGETREVVPRLQRVAAVAAPAQPTAASAPTIVRQMRGAQNMRVEILLEKALDAEASKTATKEQKAAAWCALAELSAQNPYRENARARCAAVRPSVELQRRRREAMEADLKVTVEYLTLKRKTDDEKAEALRTFLLTHTGLVEDLEVAAAMRRLLQRATGPVCRNVCARAAGMRLPTRRLKIWSRQSGAASRGRVMVAGHDLGFSPGTFEVPMCARKVGVSHLASGEWQERDIPMDCLAEVEAGFDFGRFVVKADTVLDVKTNLTWQRVASDRSLGARDAVEYCGSLRLANGGWRLPSVRELLGLVDKRYKPTIDGFAFPDTRETAFWSSSQDGLWDNPWWSVDFDEGRAIRVAHYLRLRVRCVR